MVVMLLMPFLLYNYFCYYTPVLLSDCYTAVENTGISCIFGRCFTVVLCFLNYLCRFSLVCVCNLAVSIVYALHSLQQNNKSFSTSTLSEPFCIFFNSQ